MKQEQALGSQARIEASQAHLESKVIESYGFNQRSQEQNLSTASALQDSQARIERQLQEILEVQSRYSKPVLSGSLDASSPEGRQTWMELGRLLREEGITPNVITKNKGLLIQAMKKSIQDLNDSPDASSYRTALEYQSFYSSARQSLRPQHSLSDSMNLFSSAPTLGATFPEHLMARSGPGPQSVPRYLEHEENIDDGIQSLVGGMTEASEPDDTFELPGNVMNEHTDQQP